MTANSRTSNDGAEHVGYDRLGKLDASEAPAAGVTPIGAKLREILLVVKDFRHDIAK